MKGNEAIRVDAEQIAQLRDEVVQLEKKIQIQQDIMNRKAEIFHRGVRSIDTPMNLVYMLMSESDSMAEQIVKSSNKMDKIAVEATAPNPMYSHVILGNAGVDEGNPLHSNYFTRVGGYMDDGKWLEFSGHYDMTFKEALKDLAIRVARGY